jgi:guanylate kinase
MSSSRSEAGGRRGQLFIVSAPSGTGKTTLVERLVQRVPGLRLSRSYTSRPARLGEHDGVDYNFISRAQFESMVRQGAFLESADVFGNLGERAVAHPRRRA